MLRVGSGLLLWITLTGSACALQLSVATASPQATSTGRVFDAQQTRRHVLECTTFAALSTVVPLPAVAAVDSRSLDEIKVLASKARALRAYVRTTVVKQRTVHRLPAGGSYTKVIDTVVRGRKEVLVPLQVAITAAAAATSLPDGEMKKLLELQPQEMKGHLSELDFYIQEKQIKKGSLEEYTSKTTGDTYPGGKVERELEEVCDTASDVILLLQGKAVPVRPD